MGYFGANTLTDDNSTRTRHEYYQNTAAGDPVFGRRAVRAFSCEPSILRKEPGTADCEANTVVLHEFPEGRRKYYKTPAGIFVAPGDCRSTVHLIRPDAW